MKCVVTGCCGFIGSNLVQTLLDEGHEVVGIDKNYSPLRLPYNEKAYKIHEGDYNKITKKFTFIWAPLHEIRVFSYLMDNTDIVYHLAAYVTIRNEDIHDNIKNTVEGTFELLDLIVSREIPRLVFASTSSIYGEDAVGFIDEDSITLKPISHYASGKIANEAYINSYAYHNNFRAWIFRFANVTGKNQNRGAIWDFIHQLKENPEKLTVLGNGKQRKSFFDVDDCVRGLIDIPKKDKNLNVEVYNLGNDQIITVGEIAKLVCEEVGVDAKIKYSGGDRGWVGDTPNTEISITKALNTGWCPKYTCEESVRRTAKWMLTNWNALSVEENS